MKALFDVSFTQPLTPHPSRLTRLHESSRHWCSRIRRRRSGTRAGPPRHRRPRPGFALEPISRTSRELTVERVEGDLRDQDSLRHALTGCRQLYHIAAHYTLWAKDPSIFCDVNVTGTKALLEAARDVGTERIVYCSTIGAIGLPPGGGLGTEETSVSLEQMAGHYKRSKYLAEQEVLKLAKAGLPVVIVKIRVPRSAQAT